MHEGDSQLGSLGNLLGTMKAEGVCFYARSHRSNAVLQLVGSR